ncbi:hypothetical protein KCU83_g182, partial [Aureobasidium melanogenum]
MVHTGASLFFDLDVTHSRSAFAKRGCREAVGLEMREQLQDQWGATVEIYHFLSRALGQGVAVAQIVNFDVANEITILGVDVGVQATSGRRLGSSGGRAFSLRMTERIGGTSTCWMPLRA